MSRSRSARSRPRETARTFITEADPIRRSRGCRSKIAHPKRKQALGAMNALRARREIGWETLGVYRCDECGKWHVGHGSRVEAR